MWPALLQRVRPGNLQPNRAWPPCDRVCATPAGPVASKSSNKRRSRIVDVANPGRHPAIALQPEAILPEGLDSRGFALSIDEETDEIVGALAPSFDSIICTAGPTRHEGGDRRHRSGVTANPQATIHIAPPSRARFAPANARPSSEPKIM